MAADTTVEKGGTGTGFRPHDLLEAALATCVSITVRMAAAQRGIPLTGVTARVTLDRSSPETALFAYEVELHGSLTDAQRAVLHEAARTCPVRNTLSRSIAFRLVPSGS